MQKINFQDQRLLKFENLSAFLVRIHRKTSLPYKGQILQLQRQNKAKLNRFLLAVKFLQVYLNPVLFCASEIQS